MTLHQHDPNKRPDDEFIKGSYEFLIDGNRCRLLDGRRTPGYISDVDLKRAMFVFNITAFEDKGKTWTLYAEAVEKFQFDKSSKRLEKEAVDSLRERVAYFNRELVVKPDPETLHETQKRIREQQAKILDFMTRYDLVRENLASRRKKDQKKIQEALIAYMAHLGLDEIEQESANQMVLNPDSGELVKNIAICCAELGLADYRDKILRTPPMDKLRLKAYIINRLAFTRLLYDKPLTVYRGMSSETSFKTHRRNFMSWTDDLSVAKAFSDFEDDQYQSVYLLKKQAAPETIFMTHYETAPFGESYQEKEVVLFHNDSIII